MNQAQINSIARSALKIAGAALTAHGLTAYASIVNSEDVLGLVVGLIGIWQSHQQHAVPADRQVSPTNQIATPNQSPQ